MAATLSEGRSFSYVWTNDEWWPIVATLLLYLYSCSITVRKAQGVFDMAVSTRNYFCDCCFDKFTCIMEVIYTHDLRAFQ